MVVLDAIHEMARGRLGGCQGEEQNR